MGLAYVLLSSVPAFIAAGLAAASGSGFWMAVLTFYGAGFAVLALLVAWQFVPTSRRTAVRHGLPAIEKGLTSNQTGA